MPARGAGTTACVPWPQRLGLSGTVFAQTTRQSAPARAYTHVEGGSMPTYDYYCRACDRTFEVHLSLQEHDAHQVQCPQCHSTQVQQAVTHFETVTSKKS